MKLMHRQITTMNRPGYQNSQERVAKADSLALIREPRDTSGDCTPYPM
ncbi:Uncharacterised protein [Mycobacteroides abscessus subsp. abscessus]|nr:Uncharacterised protein [Mycobacteroides abscessus subsp. abscessus]